MRCSIINRTKITLSDSTKDLGIILSNNLDWSDHYHSITAKVYKILGLLKRCFKRNSIVAKKETVHINSPVTSTYSTALKYGGHIRLRIYYCLNVFRDMHKYILCDFTSSYKSRLIKLNLLPLMHIYELNNLKYPSNYLICLVVLYSQGLV